MLHWPTRFRLLSIRSTPTMELVRQFVGFAARLDFEFESAWLPTAENGIADAASRFQFTRMFDLAPHLTRTSSPVILHLTDAVPLSADECSRPPGTL